MEEMSVSVGAAMRTADFALLRAEGAGAQLEALYRLDGATGRYGRQVVDQLLFGYDRGGELQAHPEPNGAGERQRGLWAGRLDRGVGDASGALAGDPEPSGGHPHAAPLLHRADHEGATGPTARVAGQPPEVDLALPRADEALRDVDLGRGGGEGDDDEGGGDQRDAAEHGGPPSIRSAHPLSPPAPQPAIR